MISESSAGSGASAAGHAGQCGGCHQPEGAGVRPGASSSAAAQVLQPSSSQSRTPSARPKKFPCILWDIPPMQEVKRCSASYVVAWSTSAHGKLGQDRVVCLLVAAGQIPEKQHHTNSRGLLDMESGTMCMQMLPVMNVAVLLAYLGPPLHKPLTRR